MPGRSHPWARVPLVLSVALSLGGPVGAVSATAGDPIEAVPVDTAGIAIVDDLNQARPTTDQAAQAFSDALELARNNADDFGFPWLDPNSGKVILSAATERGSGIADAKTAAFANGAAVRQVKFSYGALQEIKHEAISLRMEGVRDADLIYQTAPDHRNNRIVITVRAGSDALFEALAARYGTEAIAIRIDPDHFGGSTSSRQSDSSPFWGGARIAGPTGNCSGGFPWVVSGAIGNAMLYAGHCAPNGGSVSSGGSGMGTVAAFTEENWSSTLGTRYFTGQSTYRGDLALIRIYGTLRSDPWIYRGDTSSNTGSAVVSVFRRYMANFDQVYLGGHAGGETGPYIVDDTDFDWWYSNEGPDVIVRNATRAHRAPGGGACMVHGDSGGSIFTKVTGGVKAAGIQSGFAFNTCNIIFTDIYRAYLGLPGDVVLS